MSEEIKQSLSALWDSVAAGVSGGLIVLLFAERLASDREHRFKREHYRTYIKAIRKTIESHSAVSYSDFYRSTFQKFDEECVSVMHHIRWEHRRDRFDDARRTYPNLGIPFHIMDNNKNEENRQKILALLKELLRYAR